jgi:inositol oxygenase
MSASTTLPGQPLKDLDEWDDFLAGRYKEGKSEQEFRQYDATVTPGVAEFYRQNHEQMTVDYVLSREKAYFGLDKGQKTVWEAAEFLNTLVDDSDPDTDLTQIEHLLQTSEAMRRDGQPRWMVLTGFLHDLGKCLCLYGEPQCLRISCFLSTSRRIRIAMSLNTKQNTESTSPIAAWKTFTCLLDMTVI